MNALLLIKTGLFIHLAGITMMVGTTLAGISAHRQFGKLLIGQKDNALTTLKAIRRFPALQASGAGLVLVGGVAMMIGYHGVIMRLLWFKIKLVVIALILLNQLFIGRSLGKRLRTQTDPLEITHTVKKLTLFNGTQIALFGLIFFLSSFKLT